MSDDWVEIVEVDGVPSGPASAASADPSRNWPWWAAASKSARALALASICLTVVALGATALAAGARHHVIVIDRSVPPVSAGPDALGCPVSAACGVRAATTAAIAIRTASALFDQATGFEVYDLNRPTKVGARYGNARGRFRGAFAELAVSANCQPAREPSTAGAATSSSPSRGHQSWTDSYVRHYPLNSDPDQDGGCTVMAWCTYSASPADGPATPAPSMLRLVERLAKDARLSV